MVTTPIKYQRLSVRNDDSGSASWNTVQIATPAIVGGVLLMIFAAYIIWQRRPVRKRSYDYREMKPDWVTAMERMFVTRRKRQRTHHASAPITLDDSMRSSGLMPSSRGSRLNRSDSSDSQTPLTSTSYTFDYPPIKRVSSSPPPVSKRPGVRWWWPFGSRPREIKSEEPGSRWRVDGSDVASSSGHGNSNHGHQDRYDRLIGPLASVREDQEEDADSIIRIGENFTSVASTPLTQHFHEQTRVARGMSPVPEHPGSSGTRTPPVQTAGSLQSQFGTPVLRANYDLPPSYDLSQNHRRYPSTEDVTRFACSTPYMVMPAPARAAGYSSPRLFHGRELSSDSILATQPPMAVATSLY